MPVNKVKLFIENKILDMIADDDVRIWRKPWLFSDRDRAYNGDLYLGVNSVVTALARMYYGLESHVWLTNTKIEALNGRVWDDKKKRMVKVANSETFYHVKKDSKGIPICYWGQKELKDENGEYILDEEGEIKTLPFLMYYTVFNASSVAGLENVVDKMENARKNIDDNDKLSALEFEKKILSLYKDAPEVVHNSDGAFYNRNFDKVCLPPVSTFESRNAYIATLVHELGHSTGVKKRLNRAYYRFHKYEVDEIDTAKEELVAEFTSAFVLAHYGINETVDNSAAYIKDWNEVLKDHPGMLFDAISAADKATALILGRSKEKEKKETAVV